MDPILALMASAAVVVGVAEYVSQRRRGPFRRTLAEMPRTPARRLQARFVRVAGRARADDGGAAPTVIAPLTGRPCLACAVFLTGYAAKDIGWGPLAEVSVAAPFWVEDESGRVFVDAGAHLVVVPAPAAAGTVEGRVGDEQLRRLGPHLGNRLDEVQTAARYNELRFAETVIVAGETVSAAGHAELDVHPQGEIARRRDPPMRWTLRGRVNAPLLLTDDPALCGG